MTDKNVPEIKFVEFSEFKADASDSEGSGSFSGYANNFGVLDSYDDITLPGCFKDSLPEFLNSGFTAPDHRWGITSEIGIPVEAFEDEIGLFVKSIYHPTPDAQAIRQKVNNRLANGKKVSLSIGYRTYSGGYDYVVGEEAVPFLKNPSQEVLTYLKEQQPLVRLLKKVALKEHSIVPIGANEASEVVEGKSLIKTREEIQAERKASISGDNSKKIQILNLKLRSIPAVKSSVENSDIEFLKSMTEHHQMALEMSGKVINSTKIKELKDFAENIVKTQSAEIEQMQMWEEEWGKPAK